MTPKEKAEELIDIFTFNCRECDYEDNANQCALIAVEEILKAIPDASDDNSPYNSELLWWKEVRHEIENLKN
jgi:hypothetical protein